MGEDKALPISLSIAARGIRTAGDFANMMSATMTDLATGRLTPQVANAMANVGGKLLKVCEMQQKYGTQGDGPHKDLQLAREPIATTPVSPGSAAIASAAASSF